MRMAELITPADLLPPPREFVRENGTPDTIAGWKALADSLLTDQPCVFHRNLEISSRYAWIYKYMPAYLKWAGMAAFASHHVRLALFPLRLDRDRAGYVDIPHSLGRRKVLLLADVNTIRETNNGIFDDIFWVHLAYAAADDGIERLRGLLRATATTPPSSRASKRSTQAGRQTGRSEELVWQGNIQLLEHEQRALVQPHLDALSCPFARLFSIGSALSFEVRGVRDEVSYFTSFYYYALTRGIREGDASARVAEDHPLRRTAGAGSRPASSRASGDSTSTPTSSTRACAASSTKHATTRRTPASSRARRCPRGSAACRARRTRTRRGRVPRSGSAGPCSRGP